MDIKQRIKKYLASVVGVGISDNDDIFQRGLVDSLFAVQLVLFIEEEFSIIAESTDLDINNFSSIAALTRFVESKSSTPQ